MQVLGVLIPFVAAGGWLWWIYQTDRFEKEPWDLVWKTFGAGAAAGLGGLVALLMLALMLPSVGVAVVLLVPVHVIAMMAVLRLVPYRRPEWNDPFDGIVYGGSAGIGYGLVYTLFALLDSPLLGFRSAVFSIPIFMLAGLIIGHYLSQIRFGPPQKTRGLWVRALLTAGLYLGGIEFAQALGGEVMGRANPLASVIVFGANTVGWVMALWAMDAKTRASQYNPGNYRLWLSGTGCYACGHALPVAASFCNKCGRPLHAGQGVQG